MDKKNFQKEEEDVLKEYDKFGKKYELPDFDSLAEDFDIEKIVEKPSTFLLREIRKAMNEKISVFLQLFETFMNPSSAPMFVFSLLKNVDNDGKEKIKEVYKKIAKIEIKVLKLDILYDEKNEAGFIKDSFEKWQEIKKDVLPLFEKIEKDFDVSNVINKRGYFG